MSAGPDRPLRASDQDRHEAILALSDQFVAGRLDREEFDARMSVAAEATHLRDLDPLFADLPAHVTGSAGPSRRANPERSSGRTRPRRRGPSPAHAVMLVALAALVVLTRGWALWLLVPLLWTRAGGRVRPGCGRGHPAAGAAGGALRDR